ncbi:MAG: electron transfer flavoprotein subunit beta/FixA family protein [Syntrophobacteraceae bacterium]|nr:electron transfer flavoprotein subunit beta/FixA family protein [Desulfobacteraceae bacterium]
MMNIVACFKWVIDEADIRVDAASRKLILDRAGHKINAYDRNAIEEAVRLKELHGGTVAALTVAPPTSKACLKDTLSRGPDTVYFANDPAFVDLAPRQSATLLAAAIRTGIAFDLIVCGEGSSDLYSQQVGPALAELLEIPCVTYVNRLSFSGGEIVADRKLDDGVETVSVKLPALVTILPDINSPRIPTLKQILAAAKKPVHDLTIDALGPVCPGCLQTDRLQAATMDRKKMRFAADAAGIRSVVDALIRDGVLA